MLPLAFFVAVGIFFVDWSARSPVAAPRAGTLGEAALLLLFAYAGFENTPPPAGEYQEPARDVPFALITMIAVVTLLYTLVQLVALGTLPDLADSRAPLAEAARPFARPGRRAAHDRRRARSRSAATSATRCSPARATCTRSPWTASDRARSRASTRATARRPRDRHPDGDRRWRSRSGSFVQLAMLSVIARLTTYIGTAAAVPVLRRAVPRRPERLPAARRSRDPDPRAAVLSRVFLASARVGEPRRPAPSRSRSAP